MRSVKRGSVDGLGVLTEANESYLLGYGDGVHSENLRLTASLGTLFIVTGSLAFLGGVCLGLYL